MRSRSGPYACLAALHLCAAGRLVAQDPAGPAEVRAAIDSGNAAYIAAYASADADALARVYDPDGARLSSNGRTERGHEAMPGTALPDGG